MPTLYIISGCNGAGKTTASYSMLPEMLNCKEFVNADSIAQGLSPFQPEKVSFEAGRLMLQRIRYLLNEKNDFAFETTLSTKSYVPLIKECKKSGYEIVLIYFWLSSVELALERIKERVKKGGHNVPEEIARRRYKRGMENLFSLFIPLCDYWLVIDNSKNESQIVAKGFSLTDKIIFNQNTWKAITSKNV
jgi:predicted ABC-type ATPase